MHHFRSGSSGWHDEFSQVYHLLLCGKNLYLNTLSPSATLAPTRPPPNATEIFLLTSSRIPVAFGGGACVSRRRGLSLHHPKHHRAEIGDQPDDPHKDTEFVETDDHLLILADQDHGCPNGVDEHQRDRQHARVAVNIVAHSAHVLEHQTGAPRVANEAEPEENGMPDLETPLNTFTPYADGVEDQGKVDDDDGEGIHGGLLQDRDILSLSSISCPLESVRAEGGGCFFPPFTPRNHMFQ